MRILLVNPPNCGRSIPEEEYGLEGIKLVFRGEPLALETIAGNLEGYEVRITDLKAAPGTLADDLASFRPDIVGITGVTCEANTMVRIAAEAKAAGARWIAVGGNHASGDPGFFNREEIDFVVVGLGKASFRTLVDALATGGDGSGIPGVARILPGGALRLVPRRYGPTDLVAGKPPRYDLVERHREKYVMSGVGGKMGFVATAFGCSHRCSFCSIPPVTGGRYLTLSPEAVLRDIALLPDLPLIRLVDANTYADTKVSEALAEAIIAAGVSRKFVADVRADTVTRHPDLIRRWKEAGLATVVIGFEEIEEGRLADFDKRCSAETNREAIALLKGIGIRIVGDFIVSPDYVDEDFARLVSFVDETAIDLPIAAVLTPIPGTPLHQRWRDRITVDDLDFYTFTNALVPTRMEPKAFYTAYAEMMQGFLGRVAHPPARSDR
jgi:radical SAM superfamily enzyme YgiQ (UPF0313 family)